MKKNIVLLIFILTTGLQFSVLAQKKKVNVLFIGNSLTYQNNLPELVRKTADCDGVTLTYKMIAHPDYALEDHWNDGNAIREIKAGKYNFVIVQQGPSSQAEGYQLLNDYGIKFKALCKEYNTQLVFYMVWPAKARATDFAGVYKNYKRVATDTESIFSPAGQAWLTLGKLNPYATLYGPDNFHPNYKGSLLAALVLYGSISSKQDLSFADLKRLKDSSLSQEELDGLVKAANQTLQEEVKSLSK